TGIEHREAARRRRGLGCLRPRGADSGWLWLHARLRRRALLPRMPPAEDRAGLARDGAELDQRACAWSTAVLLARSRAESVKVGKIAGAAIALSFVGFVAYSLLYSEPVKVLRSGLLHSKDGAYVAGAVENTGPDNESISLEIRYYDGGGHQVASDTVRLDRV